MQSDPASDINGCIAQIFWRIVVIVTNIGA
ncbi:hypothetical protein AWB73_01593 [Caballeronia turbans]|jgi:hypothetical protein|nr:hypothetical protein AWB73_01593 [Caballeronia turbans]